MDGKPYTRTGDIVIAVNPYKWYDHLYAPTVRHKYAETLVWNLSSTHAEVDPRSTLAPHVYEASSLAYRGLALDGDDQSILVSGESGAGKTETVKIMLSDLASVQQGRRTANTNDQQQNGNNQSPIVQRVLDSNPLLEAFGNAKTSRNDNSSRFGKYIQLQFDAEPASVVSKSIPVCALAGSKCEVYLLEKSRVCLHNDNERTYHIFYQLLAADEDVKAGFWEGLTDTDPESFCSVGYSETDTIEGKTDAERFQYTVDSLKLVGIEGETLQNLMRVICVVLQLGNLLFDALAEKDGSVITEQDDLRDLAELMGGMSAEDLNAAFTIRTIMARNEEFKVPLNPIAAKESCDAFAKEMYAKTFLWLVRTINDATCAELNYHDGSKKSGFGLIGLLDIFGFESFDTNRFEQLCINYANEKLQQKFTQDIFQSVQQEYEYEGIELGEITYDDNTDVLDLVEGRMGLLAFLNEECVRPGGNDKGFVSKAAAMNKDNPCFIRELHFYDYQFGVHHYAGRVIYDATSFVTKNMDTLSKDLYECAAKSTNPIIAKEFVNESMTNVKTTSSSTTRAKKKAPSRRPSAAARRPSAGASQGTLNSETVWTKFKNQLSLLMANLGLTRTRYIRCIKPNTIKKPLIMEHTSTVEQLRCAGVVAAVTISRSAFPNRLEHDAVVDRFKSVWRKGEHHVAEKRVADLPFEERGKILAEALLTTALKPLIQPKPDLSGIMHAFVMGKTRTYFRAGALEYLENERLKRLGVWAVVIQSNARKIAARSRYLKLKAMVLVEQSYVRMRIARRSYRKLRAASIVAQCWYRCILAVRTLDRLNRYYKSTLIQTHWRMAMAISRLKQHVRATIQAQRIVRGALQRPKFRAALQEKREESKLSNQLVALQRKLEEAERRHIEAEKKAEEKARHALEEAERQKEKEKEEAERQKEIEEAEKEKEGSVVVEEEVVVVEEVVSVAPATPQASVAPSEDEDIPESPTPQQLSAQQQTLMDESGKMLEYLRKEVFRLRSQNTQIRTDFDLLKDNNQRLMDANASAGASFAALNQHTKQLSRGNDKVRIELDQYKQQVQKLSVTQVELREELRMKQATYVAEVQSRLQYQKALSKIVDISQDRCRDTRLVEDILKVADGCEAEYLLYMSEEDDERPFESPPQELKTPPQEDQDANRRESSGLMGSIRSFWS
jgi:myosin-5